MAKLLKEDADFHKRVEKVFEAMEENDVSIDFVCGEIRISDTKNPDCEPLQNMVLEYVEGGLVQSLPSGIEWRLRVLDS